MKKVLICVLCAIMLFCCVACTNRLNGTPAFDTQNIARITFYGYYGMGTAAEVPTEHMTAIIDWLKTFTIGKKITGDVPPGTNTYQMQIEYTDGTVIEEGLNTVVVDGKAYYLEHAEYPPCFMDIIEKSELK